MPTREDTERLLEKLRNTRPKKISDHFERTDAGLMCVLKCLLKSEKPVSAGEISSFMHVSTARVAVLIKKLEERNLVEKTCDPSDARKTMLKISEHGIKMIEEHREKFLVFFASVIERMGEDRFNQFVELSEEFRDAVEEMMSSENSFGI